MLRLAIAGWSGCLVRGAFLACCSIVFLWILLLYAASFSFSASLLFVFCVFFFLSTFFWVCRRVRGNEDEKRFLGGLHPT